MTSDDVWHEGHPEEEDEDEISEDPWRINSYNKAQATKEINNQLTKLEQEVKQALFDADPELSTNYSTSENGSTLVMPHSDSHIGAVIHDRRNVDYYSPEEAKENIEEYFDRCISSAIDRGDVEDVVLILNGDMLDGEGVYPSQRHEQEDNLRNQLRKAGNIYIEQILKLCRNFENVSVYCVPGNHGNISKRSTTNADMMLYDFVETALSYAGVNNLNMCKSGPGGFVLFDVRGWEYFARHGQDFLEHVGTSSGIRRALDWKDNYGYDIAIRSHYHSVKYEPVGDENPVIMTGSTAPPSTFAESKAANGGECGVYWFTTEENVVEGFQPIRF
jgi:hypothetical protein